MAFGKMGKVMAHTKYSINARISMWGKEKEIKMLIKDKRLKWIYYVRLEKLTIFPPKSTFINMIRKAL